MRTSAAVALLASLVFASHVLGASYQKTDGTIVDPILCASAGGSCSAAGAVHPYSGPNLVPGVVLPGTFSQYVALQYADLHSAALTGAYMPYSDLDHANLVSANLSGAELAEGNLPGVDLSGANLSGASLAIVYLREANLSGANLSDVLQLESTNLGPLSDPYYDSATDFTNAWTGGVGSTPFDPVAAGWILVSGATYQQTDGSVVPILCDSAGGSCPSYGADHPYSGVDLAPNVVAPGADLHHAHLETAHLTYANLANANLASANLLGAHLFFANLSGANLAGAYLFGAGLAEMNLSNANLANANMTGSILYQANLTNANLSGANLSNATNLDQATGFALYDSATNFTGTGFDPVAAGWILLTGSARYSQGGITAPILCDSSGGSCSEAGVVHPYSGPDLWISSAAIGAALDHANLSIGLFVASHFSWADLSYANLSNASFLGPTNLTGANLTGANLSGGVGFISVDLTGANLSGADLTDARGLGDNFFGKPFYSPTTDFTNAWAGNVGSTLFDPVAAGWILIGQTAEICDDNIDNDGNALVDLDDPDCFYLDFPLSGQSACSATITAVFDHSMLNGAYCDNGVVTAYTGETGNGGASASCVTNTAPGCNPLCGYKDSNDPSQAFQVNGNYYDGATTFLEYDGHPGIDYRTNDQDRNGVVPVLAAARGVVSFTNLDPSDPDSVGTLEVNHENGYRTRYLHLSRHDKSVGNEVARLEQIGLAGRTGATAPHLHFEVWVGPPLTSTLVRIDPYGYQGTAPNAPAVDPYSQYPQDPTDRDLWTPPWASVHVAQSCRPLCAIPTGAAGTGSVLGGSGVAGGVDVAGDVATGGDLTGEQYFVPVEDVQESTGIDPSTFTFDLPAGLVQLWKLDFSGAFTGPISAFFGFFGIVEPPPAGQFQATRAFTDPPPDLAIYQLIDGAWVALPGTVDQNTNTVSVTANGLSTFVLGIKPPTPIPTLSLAGKVILGILLCALLVIPYRAREG